MEVDEVFIIFILLETDHDILVVAVNGLKVRFTGFLDSVSTDCF